MGSYKIPTRPVTHPLITQLVQARQSRRLSQSAVGERIGRSQVTISHWEAGDRDPGLRALTEWAAVFGLVLIAADPELPDHPIAELCAGGLA